MIDSWARGRNHIGDTPLLAATVWGEIAAMTLLLDSGADGILSLYYFIWVHLIWDQVIHPINL